MWIVPPPYHWNYALFAKPGASAEPPDQTFEMLGQPKEKSPYVPTMERVFRISETLCRFFPEGR